MIDFHSHILPHIDDGASNIDTSLKMLAKSKSTGIDTVVSTSHCYPYKLDSDISDFLSMREKAYNELLSKIQQNQECYPNIVLGCEVHLVRNLSTAQNLSKLCIENTDYLLLEMPTSKWNDQHFEEVYHIIQLGFRPIIAHLDRYFGVTDRIDELLSLPVLIQINADAFTRKTDRKEILKLFEEDAVHVIGSDMHNLESRPQNLNCAYQIIDKKYGKDYTKYLKRSCEKILRNEPVSFPHIKKPSIIKKILI